MSKSNNSSLSVFSVKNFFIVILLSAVIVVGVYTNFINKDASYKALENQKNNSITNTLDSKNNDKEQPKSVVTKTKQKQFTGQDFYSLYDNFAYPNTRKIITTPEITGVNDVDVYLRSLAVQRGYKLRAIPVAEITKKGKTVLGDPFLLQDKASIDWDALTKNAALDGYAIGTTSAFRSIEDQRILFMQEYNNAKIETSKVASGQFDKALNDLMALAALPGYSRHHTGYTMDFSCDSQSSFLFKTSRCYEWVSKNNFENIKKFGWIPSYPDGTPPQGPNPEPWEFVWVGADVLYE